MTTAQKPLSYCDLSEWNNLQSVCIILNHFKCVLDLQLEILAPEKLEMMYDCCYCCLFCLVSICTFLLLLLPVLWRTLLKKGILFSVGLILV